MTTRYTEDHEYIKMDGDIGTVGITHFAQDKLGDLVYVEQPKVGRTLAAIDAAFAACAPAVSRAVAAGRA
jgi:glycine cleavage system H protein